jgi:hypothetical protein
MSDEAGLQLRLTAHSDRFDEHASGWLSQEAELLESLHSQVSVRRDTVVSAGDKGVVEGIILALGSAGAFNAAVTCLRVWLGRDRTRRIELTWTENGTAETILLQGTAIPDAEFAKLAEVVRAKAASRD